MRGLAVLREGRVVAGYSDFFVREPAAHECAPNSCMFCKLTLNTHDILGPIDAEVRLVGQ